MTAHTIMVGNTVWATFGSRGWRKATVLAIGQMRYEQTRIKLAFETGVGATTGHRKVSQLQPRNPELNGKDKPD